MFSFDISLLPYYIKNRLILVGYVARVGERGVAYRIKWGNLKEGENLEDPVISLRVILKFIFEK